MNRKMKFSLSSLIFLILTSHSFAEVDLSELFENIHPAVATVITYDKNKKPLGQGSGFFIDAYGHLITNYHVLKGASRAEVRTYAGKKYPISSVISEDRKMDLIKVLVDIPWSSVQWVNATGALPSIAERIIVIGSPMGLELTVSEGIVSSVREIPDLGKILQISAAISPGSSGGPVVNMKGQVVGIVSFYLIKGQNLNFAIPARYIFDLKPSKTVKTISEWTYGIGKKAPRKTPRKGRLFVHTEPEGARVRILNIKPKFYQGIVLITGPYHIEVSADGYEMKKFWIKIQPGENQKLKIPLEKISQVLVEEPNLPQKPNDYELIDPSRYEKYANGVVLDTKTDLEWYAGPDKNMNWYEAQRWVKSLSIGGGGWRMPTRFELKTLYIEGAGTSNRTTLLKSAGWWVWSGGKESSWTAWVFNFEHGVSYYNNLYHSSYGERGFAVRYRRTHHKQISYTKEISSTNEMQRLLEEMPQLVSLKEGLPAYYIHVSPPNMPIWDNKREAQELLSELHKKIDPSVQINSKPYSTLRKYTVYYGPYSSKLEAARMAKKLKDAGYSFFIKLTPNA
ncbi:trypsin-like peptidase domain-containing protein [Thermodesulfobacteriota bacterium]